MCTRRGLGYAESVRGTASAPETRAGCGSAARPDLRRGRWATTVPTPTIPASRSNETAALSGNGSPVIGAKAAVVRGRPSPAVSPFVARVAHSRMGRAGGGSAQTGREWRCPLAEGLGDARVHDAAAPDVDAAREGRVVPHGARHSLRRQLDDIG